GRRTRRRPPPYPPPPVEEGREEAGHPSLYPPYAVKGRERALALAPRCGRSRACGHSRGAARPFGLWPWRLCRVPDWRRPCRDVLLFVLSPSGSWRAPSWGYSQAPHPRRLTGEGRAGGELDFAVLQGALGTCRPL